MPQVSRAQMPETKLILQELETGDASRSDLEFVIKRSRRVTQRFLAAMVKARLIHISGYDTYRDRVFRLGPGPNKKHVPMTTKEIKARYRQKHRERLNEEARQKREADREGYRAYQRAYRELTREKRNARQRELRALKREAAPQTVTVFGGGRLCGKRDLYARLP